MTHTWDREAILKVSAGFLRSRILLTAAELDLFTKLDGRPATVESLCEQQGWSARPVRILLDAVAAMGLLSKGNDGRYSVEEPLAGLLAKGHEESVLPMLLHRAHMWNSWSNLTEIVETGNNPNLKPMDSRSDEDLEAFIGAMHVVGRGAADTIAESVDLRGFKAMLDLGGGPGAYTMAFLKRAPQMTATLFDLPKVVEMARKRLTQEGFIDRVKIVAGDYNTDEFPGGYDLALVSAVIHINSRSGNRDLFKKVYRSLDPGGTILVRDYMMEPSRIRPVEGAVFAVNMLTATSEGDTYTFAEVREDLESAGFTDVRMIRNGERMDQLVSAVK